MHEVSMNPNERMVDLLVEKGADVDHQDRDGQTPLHFLCKYRDADILNPEKAKKTAEALLRAGANPHIPNKEGKTAWQMAQGSEYAKDFIPIFRKHSKHKAPK